jgi:dolichyl-phosphate-mannose-protein mannosyltransferase
VPKVEEQKPLVQEPASPPPSDAPVPPPQLPAGQSILSKEEKIEYRDQHGNLLDPEVVKSLEGKVSFKTRYETRTRIIDAHGNEVEAPEASGVAPPHPDVENVDRETSGVAEPGAQDGPASQSDVSADASKEKSAEQVKQSEAKPASEGNEATA